MFIAHVEGISFSICSGKPPFVPNAKNIVVKPTIFGGTAQSYRSHDEGS